MYQELFSLSYNHEYFNEGSPLKLHCKLSPASTRLSTAIDGVLIVKPGGFKYLWNSRHYSRSELIKTFSGDSLVVYLTPFDVEHFFNVTDDLPMHDHADENAPASEKQKQLNVFLFHSDVREGNRLIGFHQPVNRLLMIQDIADIKEFTVKKSGKINIDSQPDTELRSLYQRARAKPHIAFVLPIDQLNADSPNDFQLTFKSKSVFFKYYFTSLKSAKALRIQVQRSDQASNAASFSPALAYVDQGSEVPTFVSESPIKLQRQPDYKYQLISQINGVEEVLFDALPQPDVQQYFKHNHPQMGSITVLEAFVK